MFPILFLFVLPLFLLLSPPPFFSTCLPFPKFLYDRLLIHNKFICSSKLDFVHLLKISEFLGTISWEFLPYLCVRKWPRDGRQT